MFPWRLGVLPWNLGALLSHDSLNSVSTLRVFKVGVAGGAWSGCSMWFLAGTFPVIPFIKWLLCTVRCPCAFQLRRLAQSLRRGFCLIVGHCAHCSHRDSALSQQRMQGVVRMVLFHGTNQWLMDTRGEKNPSAVCTRSKQALHARSSFRRDGSCPPRGVATNFLSFIRLFFMLTSGKHMCGLTCAEPSLKGSQSGLGWPWWLSWATEYAGVVPDRPLAVAPCRAGGNARVWVALSRIGSASGLTCT